MKPTLYAEDVAVYPTDWEDVGLDLARILPRRCPARTHGATANNCICGKDGCRGWLYPDPPEWWPGTFPYVEWPEHCHRMWQLLGIVEMGPVVINPEAIGDPDQTPIVRMDPEIAAALGVVEVHDD